jgi:hypothetical protein
MSGADRTVAGLAWRESRRSGLIVVAGLAGLVVAFGGVYETLATTTVNTAGGDLLGDSPTVRALYGAPDAIGTRGGFVV